MRNEIDKNNILFVYSCVVVMLLYHHITKLMIPLGLPSGGRGGEQFPLNQSKLGQMLKA